MESGILSIKTIFGQQRRHLVPLYQRPYVWRRQDQWEPLWDDLRGLAERIIDGKDTRPHFLGAIVLDQVKQPTGYVESRWVIDGQQRLTTMQIVLEAFSDLCQQYEAVQMGCALLSLTRNLNPMEEPKDVEFKVWPTNSDQSGFRTVMRAGSADEVRAAYGCDEKARTVGDTIGDAYLYFHDTMAEWLDRSTSGFDQRIDALFHAIPDMVRLVVIDLGSDDDAQLIFETLNARGTPLLPIDLVKNFLFHKAQIQKMDLEPLYEKYWQSFDESSEYWREEIGVGHNVRARIDGFLQQYLTLKRCDEIGRAHLYGAYCDLFNGSGGNPQVLMAELVRYSAIFRQFDDPKPETRAAAFFERLRAIDVTAAHPFLLELFDRHGGQPKEVERTLAVVESFLVRRMICQLNTRGYNRLFIEFLAALDGPTEELSGRVAAQLALGTADSNRWPSDREFKSAWREQPIFRRLTRQRVRMILMALEMNMHSDKGENVTFDKKLSVEHLMPRKWRTDSWPLPGAMDEEVEIENRERALHTIGNLTLLRQKLNASVSNGAFHAKQKAILKYSALNLNRPLAAWDGWDEGAIQKRSDELFRVAKRIWTGPEE